MADLPIVHVTPTILLPERSCYHCEYFDRGYMDSAGESDCLNRNSPRFQTKASDYCINWVKTS